MKLGRKTLDTFRHVFLGLSCIICSSVSLGVTFFTVFCKSSVPLLRHYKSFLIPCWVRPRNWSVRSSIKHSLGLQGLAEDLPEAQLVREPACHTEPVCVRGQHKSRHQGGPVCCNRGNGVSLSPKALPEGGEVMPAGDIAFEIGDLKICYLKSSIFGIL